MLLLLLCDLVASGHIRTGPLSPNADPWPLIRLFIDLVDLLRETRTKLDKSINELRILRSAIQSNLLPIDQLLKRMNDNAAEIVKEGKNLTTVTNAIIKHITACRDSGNELDPTFVYEKMFPSPIFV